MCVVGLKLCVCVCVHACVCVHVCVCVRARVESGLQGKVLPAMSIFFNLEENTTSFYKSQACLSRITEKRVYQRVQPKVYGGHTEAEAQSLFISCC